jgi:hypothetical protein
MVTGSPTVGVAAETVAVTMGFALVVAASTADTGSTMTSASTRITQVIKPDLRDIFIGKNEVAIGIRVMGLFFLLPSCNSAVIENRFFGR